MSKLSKRDYERADRTFSGFIKQSIEQIEIPEGELNEIINTAEEPLPLGKTTPLSLPVRATAAAAILIGFLYLSICSLAPEVFKIEQEDNIHVETIMELKNSAGHFFKRVGESMYKDLNRTNL
ncbi:MAG: hypothetical protein JEY99_10675 [Spirochaetales bacterium]|nr:hypothetical protein [Spirochaetales bacterium]